MNLLALYKKGSVDRLQKCCTQLSANFSRHVLNSHLFKIISVIASILLPVFLTHKELFLLRANRPFLSRHATVQLCGRHAANIEAIHFSAARPNMLPYSVVVMIRN